MPKLPILRLPDPLLRKKSLPVETVDAAVLETLDSMLETMYAAPGIGLAAPQVGILRRMIVIDTVRDDAPKNPRVLINPEILHRGPEFRAHEEGCLSIPEMYAEIMRPSSVTVKFVDRQGGTVQETFDDLLATVVQHEIDHLDGILFIDHLSRLKRDLIVKKVLKAQRDKDNPPPL